MTDTPDPDDLLKRTREKREQHKEDIEAFHEAVKSESDADVLETQATLAGDITVDVSAKRNGELIDRMGHIEEQLEYVDNKGAGTYKISKAADDASQLLADVVDDAALTKDEFYKVYRSEGLAVLGEMLNTVFEALNAEQERRQGAVDGFRAE